MAQSNEIITTIEQWFAKAPALPTNIKDVLVKITPILALVFGILGVLGSIAGMGLLTAFSPLAAMGGGYGVASYGAGILSAVIWLVSAVLMLAAFPGLNARKQNGWNLFFWSEVINLVGSLIALSIVSGIIGALIGFYLLFQIKPYYK